MPKLQTFANFEDTISDAVGVEHHEAVVLRLLLSQLLCYVVLKGRFCS